MRLVVVVRSLTIDGSKIAAARRTLHLKLRALQEIVVFLMLRKNSHTAAIGTLNKLFGALAHMPERRIVWCSMCALLVHAPEIEAF